MAVWQWSHTATSNANSDPSMNWAEGIPPSIINDNVRAMMARVAEWRDDTAGFLFSGGTAPNYTIATNQGFTATPPTGALLAWVPSQTSAGGDVLSCDGGSSFPIEFGSGASMSAGTLIAGTPYTMVFNGGAWAIRDNYGAPFVVPIGGMIDWTMNFLPSSNFAFPAGQAISRSTYSSLFASYNAMSLPYGSGDGSTTFNIPDLRGRVSVCLDVLGGTGQGNAGRIGTTSTDSGTIVGTTLGSSGGAATHIQTGSELAIHSHSASSSDSGHQHAQTGGTIGVSGTGVPVNASGDVITNVNTATGFANISTSIGNAGGNAQMALLQPSIMLTKILRIA